MAKYIAQIIIAGSKILGRAFAQALKEEYAASQRAASARQNNSSYASEEESIRNLSSGMSLQEAKLILNIKDIDNKEELLKKYEHLFLVNDKSKGGSLYLQSKVFRAKERIEAELSGEIDQTDDKDGGKSL